MREQKEVASRRVLAIANSSRRRHMVRGLGIDDKSNRRKLINVSRATLLALGSPEYVSA